MKYFSQLLFTQKTQCNKPPKLKIQDLKFFLINFLFEEPKLNHLRDKVLRNLQVKRNDIEQSIVM